MNSLGVDKYEIDAWIERLGSQPKERVAHHAGYEYYSINRIHVFLLENGQYAVVTESGCSCYCSEDANIDLHPNKQSAMKAFNDWMKENRENE